MTITSVFATGPAAEGETVDRMREVAFERNCRIACYLFVGDFFFTSWHGPGNALYMIPGQQYLVRSLFAGLFLVWWFRERGGAASRTFHVAFILTLVAIPGYWLYGSNPGEGGDGAYLKAAISYILLWAMVAGFAYTFYSEELFIDVWLKTATVATVIALVGFALATGVGLSGLVTFSDDGGGWRLTGLLDEPSAWAPVIPAGIFLAWRRGKHLLVLMFALAGLLARSPTAGLTLVLSMAVILLIRKTSLFLKLMVAILLMATAPWIIPAFKGDPVAVDYRHGNPLEVMMGRLVSGFNFVQTGGVSGSNVRAGGAQNILETLQSHEWLWAGRGLGAADVYFPFRIGTVQAWSLPVSILFDLGVIGLSIYALLALRAMWRMRNTEAALLFIPFLMASAINSAQGNVFYKFSLLAILLFVGPGSPFSGTGWTPSRSSRGNVYRLAQSEVTSGARAQEGGTGWRTIGGRVVDRLATGGDQQKEDSG